MKANIKILIAIVAILILVVAGYCIYSNIQKNNEQKALVEKTLNPVNGEKIGETLPTTNPFDTKVNPFDAYKNPFGK